MAASRVDSEVGEYQLTSATAAVLSRSSSEARVVVKSWPDHNHRVKYIEESLNRSNFADRDHPSKHSNGNGITGNHYIQDNEEWPEQEQESLSENKIHIASKLDVNEDTNRDKMDNDISNVINDRKLIMCKTNNENFSDSKNKLEIICTNSLNNEIEKTRQIFNKCNQTSGTSYDNEYDDRQTCVIREIKIVTAPTNNCINNSSESAYPSQDADKTIESNKCERARDIESRKNDCDEGRMEISSPRSRAYSHGDNVIVSAATPSTGAFREALRDEASCKVVHSSTKDSRTPGKTRRSASARNVIGDRGEPKDRKTDIVISCIRDKKRGSVSRKCEKCGESHFSYGQYSRLWKYSGYLNREVANQDAAKIAVNRATDSTRLAAPIAAAVLYRSRSLPRLSNHDSGVACSDQTPAAPEQTHAVSRQLVADLRQLLTLKQHYYPEGGWGWVILLVGLLVQILSHGTHGAVGVFLQQVEVKFGSHMQLQAESSHSLNRGMKNRERNGRAVVQSPAYEDSGVAISGELGEPSFSEECEGIASLQTPKEIEEDANLDPRYAARCTIRQHYYPENGWGWVIVVTSVMVQILATGIHGAAGAWLLLDGTKRYRQTLLNVGWLGAMSTGVALLVSPVTIAFCRRKSTRVTAVLGGLVTALGCLFTSFASQFHQLFFSYGTVVGIGVGMTRDCSTLMVAQYFKRKRELVEIFIVSGSGLGIAVMSAFIKGTIENIGWRLGLQAVTGVVFLTFILGTFYRSASLYHPQRRAILHLKNQKRKIKDKNKADNRPPFFDFSTLKSKTVRILLVSTGISAFGINTPIFYLVTMTNEFAHQAEEEGLGDTVVLLQAYLGLAWTLGCVAFGLLVVHRSVECRIARQYLTQAAVFVCGLCILALTAVQGNYHGYVMFAWIYGIFCGGYHYSLKMYTYERVRARNFARTWGFVQCSQAIPIAIGVPISGYINVGCGGKAGYYFSSTCVLVGSFTLFFIDLHKRNLSRHKHTRANGTKHTCASDSCPQRRRPSFSQEPENERPHVAAAGAAGATAAALVLGANIAPAQGEAIDVLGTDKPELTCISEEGIADMDLPDNLLEDLDYIGDYITSCNKVEKYLMLSEFENNLIAEMPIIMDRCGRRWSLARSKTNQSNCGQTSGVQSTPNDEEVKPKWRFTNVPPNANSRMITVIDEASA